MRLIKGPQIQRPVAGPVNMAMSLICCHILWFSNPTTTSVCCSSSCFSSLIDETERTVLSFSLTPSLKRTWSWLTHAVKNLYLDLVQCNVGGKRGLRKVGEAKENGGLLNKLKDGKRNLGTLFQQEEDRPIWNRVELCILLTIRGGEEK